jgi:hypothetical protein
MLTNNTLSQKEENKEEGKLELTIAIESDANVAL